jgi:hypothetical protein
MRTILRLFSFPLAVLLRIGWLSAHFWPLNPLLCRHRPAQTEKQNPCFKVQPKNTNHPRHWLECAPPVAPHAQVKTEFVYPAMKVAQIAWDPETNSITLDSKLPGWVFNTQLVAKPNQLIKPRGKASLLALNKTWDEAKPWIAQRAGKPQKVGLVLSVTPYYRDVRKNGYPSSDLIIFNDQAVNLLPPDEPSEASKIISHVTY